MSLSNPASSVAVKYNRNQLDFEPVVDYGFSFKNPVINIDYLVLNCEGSNEHFDKINSSTYQLELQDVGTKVFKNRYFLMFENEKVATILTNPHSKAIKQDLVQVQISNHLFYTYNFTSLRKLVEIFILKALNLKITTISRLDISIDFDNSTNAVQNLANLIQNNELLLAGKDKAFNPHYVSNKGKSELTGLYIGKRSSSRYLRVYNKTLEMQKTPKEYILERWKKHGLENNNVWRCEYELTNVFFHNRQINNETISTQIFSQYALLKLFQEAEKNHFELKKNTGKSELNKEQTIPFFEWSLLFSTCEIKDLTISKIKKIIEPSILVQKRLLKAIFREYYISKQSYQNIFMIQYVLEKYHLYDFLEKKLPYYIDEFEKAQKAPFLFDYNLFQEHLSELYHEQ